MSAPTATPLALGDPLPPSGPLLGTDGRSYSTDGFADAAVLVVVFVSNGCPTVRLYEQRLAALDRRYRHRGVQIVLVNSNNPYLSPPDAYERMIERAERFPVPFPYVKDDGGELARTCGAVCTPHAFALDHDRRLRYRGRIDDSRTGRRVTSDDLEHAIADLLQGRPPRVAETAPFGCAIVW
ncbi:MAG TPA: thioredoxin family protein [Acidimicrobiales bacterium]|nr:thioredoxin family protein [Acidimicrobiales bacterium]